MEKRKLIDARENKNYTQLYIAEKLGINESSYCRRERGLLKISLDEWEKLSQILDVSIEDIIESDEIQCFINKDNSTVNVNYQGTNTINSFPEYVVEIQQKYIQKLEEENRQLKERLKQYEK